jgi:hypothetical protein
MMEIEGHLLPNQSRFRVLLKYDKPVVGNKAKNPCWYFIVKMKIAARRAALVDSVGGRKTLADKNDDY